MRARFVIPALLVVLAGAIPLGRSEGSRSTASELRKIEAVRAAVGNPLSARLQAVANLGNIQCLVYQSGTYLYALELCRDLDGRLVRAIDATGAGEERVWDISTDARTAPMLLPTNDFSVPDKLLDQRHGIEAVGSIVTRRLQNCASLVVKEPRNKVSALLARASCGEAVAVLNAGELALRRLHEVDLLARLKALEPVTAAELTLARVVIPRRPSAALAAVRRARNRAVGTLQDFDRAVGVRLAQPGTMVS